jgi:hypothetical protein
LKARPSRAFKTSISGFNLIANLVEEPNYRLRPLHCAAGANDSWVLRLFNRISLNAEFSGKPVRKWTASALSLKYLCVYALGNVKKYITPGTLLIEMGKLFIRTVRAGRYDPLAEGALPGVLACPLLSPQTLPSCSVQRLTAWLAIALKACIHLHLDAAKHEFDWCIAFRACLRPLTPIQGN